MAETKPKLLIVEDDEGLQAQLKWAYEDFDVILADTRETAVAAVRAEEPAVVTLDLGLPPDPDGTSEGFAVLEAIMAIKPDTKVIVASGHGARESALRAVEEGAYDFYQKPVDIEELGLIVGRAALFKEDLSGCGTAACVPTQEKVYTERVLNGQRFEFARQVIGGRPFWTDPAKVLASGRAMLVHIPRSGGRLVRLNLDTLTFHPLLSSGPRLLFVF